MLSVSPIRSICILGCIQTYDFYTLLMSWPLYHHILNSVSRHFLTHSLFSHPCSPLAPMCMEYLFPSLYFEPMCGLKMEVGLFYTAERWVFLFLLRFCSSVATEDRNWRARSSVVPGTGTIKHHGELRGEAEAGNTSPPLSLRNWFVWGHRWVICGARTIIYTCLLILALCPFQIPCYSFLLYHQYLKRNSFETEHFVLMQSPKIKENPQSRITIWKG